MPAPALSNRAAPQSTYAAHASTYAAQSAVQQANYAQSATPQAGYGAYGARQQVQANYGQDGGTARLNATRPTPRVRMSRPAPNAYAPQVVIPQDRTASNAQAPVQQAAYTAPADGATAKRISGQPATQSKSLTWAAGGR
jgi:hypothetical protein